MVSLWAGGCFAAIGVILEGCLWGGGGGLEGGGERHLCLGCWGLVIRGDGVRLSRCSSVRRSLSPSSIRFERSLLALVIVPVNILMGRNL